MAELPSGTVSLLFTDVEGSTALLRRLGDRYAEVHAQHRRLLRDVVFASGGNEVDNQGDAFFFVFPRVRDAAAAAVAAQRALDAAAWPDGVRVRVRMAIHTGEPTLGEEGYLGLDVVRAARLSAAAHGGQVLLSETAAVLLGDETPPGTRVVELGEQALKDLPRAERVHELAIDDRPETFPALRAGAPAPMAAAERADALAREAVIAMTEIGPEVERRLADAFERAGIGDLERARALSVAQRAAENPSAKALVFVAFVLLVFAAIVLVPVVLLLR